MAFSKCTVVAFSILWMAVTGADAVSPRLVCYYPNWSSERRNEYSFQIEDIPGDLCTHVAYVFLGIDEITTELISKKPSFDEENDGFVRFRALKDNNPDLKLIVSVGGWMHGGGPFHRMATYANSREKFIASVVAFMERYNLDGFEMVWLWPGAPDREGTPEDKDNFYYLVRDLKQAFRTAGKEWEVIIQVPIDRTRISVGYKQDLLCQSADFIHLAGYDLRGPWTGSADVHSILQRRPHDTDYFYTFNLENGVDSWQKNGCRPNQIVIGLPLYGRTYTLDKESSNRPGSKASGPGEMGPVTRDPGLLGYFEICENLKVDSWSVRWDMKAESPYAVRGKQWIGYENEISLGKKFEWALEKGLAGVYAYTLDLDDYVGTCGRPFPLLRSLAQVKENKTESDVVFAISRQ